LLQLAPPFAPPAKASLACGTALRTQQPDVFCFAPNAGSYALRFLSVVSEGVDGVFTAADPSPFIGLHYLQVG
jgi:hypothetical protein